MIDRTLSDGLVDGIGGAQLLGLRSEFKISVLKVLGTVPPELKTAAIQAEQLGLMEAEAASEEPKSAYVEEVQDATADGKESIASASEHETDQLGIEAGHGEAGKQEDTVAATEYEESHSAESATGKSQNRFVGA